MRIRQYGFLYSGACNARMKPALHLPSIWSKRYSVFYYKREKQRFFTRVTKNTH